MSEPTVVTSLDYLGALTAEHVLGWSVCREHEHCDGCNEQVVRISGVWNCFDEVGNPVDPAVLIEDAWIVVDWMAVCGYRLELTVYTGVQSFAHFPSFASEPESEEYERTPLGSASAAPAAICLAACAALGHPVTLKLEDTNDE